MATIAQIGRRLAAWGWLAGFGAGPDSPARAAAAAAAGTSRRVPPSRAPGAEPRVRERYRSSAEIAAQSDPIVS